MFSVYKVVRAGNWFVWKLPPLLAVGYALCLVGHIDPARALRVLPLLLLCVCSVAAFGYIVNDVFDISCDLAAGKENAMTHVSHWQRSMYVGITLAAGATSLAFLPRSRAAVILLGVNYVLPLIYSAPPIRLKERGILGVLADSLAAHVFPTLFFCAVLIPMGNARESASVGVAACAAIWAFGLGLRGILIHQLRDRQHDRATDIRTFVTNRPPETIRFLILRVTLPVEMIALAGFLLLVAPESRLLALVFVLYLISETVKVGSGTRVAFIYPEKPGFERYVPLVNNNFYELWLPFTLAVQLSLKSPKFIWIGIVHLFLFGPMLIKRRLEWRRQEKMT